MNIEESKTLIESLRALARSEHDDHSVADEAADVLLRMVEELENVVMKQKPLQNL